MLYNFIYNFFVIYVIYIVCMLYGMYVVYGIYFVYGMYVMYLTIGLLSWDCIHPIHHETTTVEIFPPGARENVQLN